MESHGAEGPPVFVSIQINSNRPAHLARFIDSVERTASRPDTVELLVHLDRGDEATEHLLRDEQSRRQVRIRYLVTSIVGGFFDLWKPLNELYRLTAPSAYFLHNTTDEARFETGGWDDILRRYVGYHDDHIFRIRASRLRYRNYRDVWECGFAPDGLAFYTKRWLDIVGGWNPCMGPDSFQQCVAYYLWSHDPFSITQVNRDIPDPFLRFSGEGAGLGLSGPVQRERVFGGFKAWFELMSPAMQQEARRRAMMLLAHIRAAATMSGSASTITDDPSRGAIVLHDLASNLETTLPYRVSALRVNLRNGWRALRYHYYGGGGEGAAHRTLAEGVLFYLRYRVRPLDRFLSAPPAFLRWLSPAYRIPIRRLRRKLVLLAPRLKSEGRPYYLYGTGEYARFALIGLRRHGVPPPATVIENPLILSERGWPDRWMTIPLAAEDRIIPTLAPDDRLLIGSATYQQEVLLRLKAHACRAMIVTLAD